MLERPLKVSGERLKVLKRVGRPFVDMGEAVLLDGIANSIDAEVVAIGDNDKNAPRGAIIRHGRYTLWGFVGGVDAMTDTGRRLFVNTVFYAASHADSAVLERKHNETRDTLFGFIELAKYRHPELLHGLRRFFPAEIRDKSPEQTQTYIEENRDYLRYEGAGFEVDGFAKRLGIANYKRELLERCIENLRGRRQVIESVATLARYTGQTMWTPTAWGRWYAENKDYLFFSDCQGSHFLIDEQAKAKGVSTAELRGWSSEQINYTVHRVSEAERVAHTDAVH